MLKKINFKELPRQQINEHTVEDDYEDQEDEEKEVEDVLLEKKMNK
jgi:hypothetical protein